MSKGYIHNERGELEEVLDYSCDGEQVMVCPQCGQCCPHWLYAISDMRGQLWMCSACFHIHP